MARERTQLSTMTKSPSDLKFLLVGPSGCGKTHFLGTYTAGPIHVYCFDPKGHLTLLKSKNPNITIDQLIDEDLDKAEAYRNFAKTWNKDASEGLFKYLAENNGILAVDSLSTMSQAILDEVLRTARLDKPGLKIISQDLWGQQSQIIKHTIREFNALPCMGVMTAHEELVTDSNGVTRYYPLTTGKLKTQIGLYFSEIYCFRNVGKERRLDFHPDSTHPVQKTRIFPETMSGITNPSLDTLVQKYLTAEMPF